MEKDWTYEDNLNEEQKSICKVIGWGFDRYGITNKNGERIVEKFYDDEDFLEITGLKNLSKRLEMHCLKEVGVSVNYKRDNMIFIPESYKLLSSNETFTFNPYEASYLSSKDYNEMMRKSLLHIVFEKLK